MTDIKFWHVFDVKDLRIQPYDSDPDKGMRVCFRNHGLRVTHMPTGIMIEQPFEISDVKTRQKALRLLAKKLKENYD